MRAFLILTILLFSASAARADWQYTRWGMSPAEVQQASRGATSPATGAQQQQWRMIGRPELTPLLQAGYSAGGYDFVAKFYFDSAQRLSGILLDLVQVRKQRQLRSDLIGVYGPPVMTTPAVSEWRDIKAGNIIDLDLMDDIGANIFYSRIPNGL